MFSEDELIEADDFMDRRIDRDLDNEVALKANLKILLSLQQLAIDKKKEKEEN